MGLKHIWKISQYRPSRSEARFVLKYLRYHDQRTYRAISKMFHVRYGIQAEEWADSLVDGGRFQRFINEYMRYMPRHDWGRHISLGIALGIPGIYYAEKLFYWYHEDTDIYRVGAEYRFSYKRHVYSL